MDNKFIAVSCHFDIINWLDPDWIFSTDSMEMLPRGSLQREKLRFKIREEKGYWNIFRRYHYLNYNLSRSSRQFVLFNGNCPIGFCAIINFPSSVHMPCWKVHRLVILPDYQGISLGSNFLNIIGKYYNDKNEYFGITTSLNGFAKSLIKNKNYVLINAGRFKPHSRETLHAVDSSSRNTYSFRYVGNNAPNT